MVGFFGLFCCSKIIDVVIDNTTKITISLRQDRKREGDEQMRKQQKVSVRMRFTLYFLGVEESHFV